MPYKTVFRLQDMYCSQLAGRMLGSSHTCDQGTLASEIGEATDDGRDLAARTGVLHHSVVCSGEQPPYQLSTGITTCAISQVQQPIHQR